MAREKVYVDSAGKVVQPDDPSAAFIYDAEDAKRLGYVKPEKKASAKKAADAGADADAGEKNEG